MGPASCLVSVRSGEADRLIGQDRHEPVADAGTPHGNRPASAAPPVPRGRYAAPGAPSTGTAGARYGRAIAVGGTRGECDGARAPRDLCEP
ncbi:hypothetical protein SSPS47_33040 [Streptomyces sp. S4.7]|nr:hypothetical protein SSPS47_33040 [Streptomyces sp. S4.7]